MVGLPKNRQVFDKRSSECDLIRIEEGRYNIGVDMLMNIINALETKILLV